MKNALDTAFQERVKKGINQQFEQGFKQGFEQGFKQGFKQGIKQAEIAFATEMLRYNEPLEKMIRYTSLTEAQLEKLRTDG